MPQITIEHFGFDFPPFSLIELLQSLDLEQPTHVVIFEPLNKTTLPLDYVKTLPKQNLYIIINTHEGASHLWFDRLINELTTSCGVPLSHIVLRSACLMNPNSPIPHVHTIVDECWGFVNNQKNSNLEQTPNTTHHFLCLNRLHRWQRYALVKQLLDRDLQSHGKITYLQSPNTTDPRFPMTLTATDISWEQQRDTNDPALSGALINVITESAYEIEPGTTVPQTHYLPGITEKTYKCFYMHQIPVWLAPYRTVDCIRNLGFDVFDDVVDHSYDLEPDPVQRIGMVADQVQKLCQLQELASMRSNMYERFMHNIQTLKRYTDHKLELPQWQKIFT